MLLITLPTVICYKCNYTLESCDALGSIWWISFGRNLQAKTDQIKVDKYEILSLFGVIYFKNYIHNASPVFPCIFWIKCFPISNLDENGFKICPKTVRPKWSSTLFGRSSNYQASNSRHFNFRHPNVDITDCLNLP
jgi:hypothetical protein